MATKRMQVRRDTGNNWADMEGVLADGELGWDKTEKVMRVGDGVSAFENCQIIGAAKKEILLNDGLPFAFSVALTQEQKIDENNWYYGQTINLKRGEILIDAYYFAEAKENFMFGGLEVTTGMRLDCGKIQINDDRRIVRVEKLIYEDEAGIFNAEIYAETLAGNWVVINENEVDAAKWNLYAVYVVI